MTSFGKTEYMAGSSEVNIHTGKFYMSTNEADPMKMWIFAYFTPEGIKLRKNEASAQIEK